MVRSQGHHRLKNHQRSYDVVVINELNNFYAWFERGHPTTATKAVVSPDQRTLTLSLTNVGVVLSRIEVCKFASADGNL